MSGSTNFQVFNPTGVNQENDLTYNNDPQRVGGVIDGQPFLAALANKFMYQQSTGIAALMDMMAAKGFVVSDSNRGTLASVLAAIQTTADSRLPLQGVSYSPTVTLNAAAYSGFQITVSGNITINFTNAIPGTEIWLMFSNDSAGGHAINIPAAVGEVWYDTTPNAQSQLFLQVVSDGSMRALTPGISATGINGTPIGQSGNPQPGRFSTLVAGASSLASASIAGALGVGGNATINGYVAAPQFFATLGTSGSNGYAFSSDNQTGSFSPSVGTLYLMASNTIAIAIGATGITIPLGVLFQGNVTMNGGMTINGNIAGNPNFTGTPTASTPGATDNTARIPNTSWVQALIVAVFGAGFAVSLSQNGYIKFPTALGGLVIQWGLTSSFNGTASFSFPTSFPNSCFVVVITPAQTGGSANFTGTTATSATGFTAYNDGAGSPAMYIAIGH
jgi:hypothetical protein